MKIIIGRSLVFIVNIIGMHFMDKHISNVIIFGFASIISYLVIPDKKG